MKIEDTLNRIAEYCKDLEVDLVPTPPASGTNSGLRQQKAGPRPPCNETKLDEKIDVEAELHDILVRAIVTFPPGLYTQELPDWCHWLRDHPERLRDNPDREQLEEDLLGMERSMREMVKRNPPKVDGEWLRITPLRTALACHGYTVSAEQVRKWASEDREHVRKRHTIDGKVTYSFQDALSYLTCRD